MLDQVSTLLLATAVWLATHHLIPREPLRGLLVGRFGLNGYNVIYSVIAVVSLGWMIIVYSETTRAILWHTDVFHYLTILAVPISFVVLVAGYTRTNPTGLMQEGALGAKEPAKGMHRITRHPVMWAGVLWAVTHLLAKGDVASIVFFGGLALSAILGMYGIDAKLARRQGKEWERFLEVTSLMPFGAILSGRNRFPWGEVGMARIAGGLFLALVFFYFHEKFFGVPVL